MYGKLFTSMYDGTLRLHWQALVTFQQMICLCDADGVVDMTPMAIHGRTGIPIEHIEEGIKHLEAPDPFSRTPDLEGRRIERLDSHRPWGWRIVNHQKYRDLIDAETVREQNRVRQQRMRDKKREPVQEDMLGEGNAESRDVTEESRAVTASNAESRHTDTHTDTRKDNTGPVDRLFALWRTTYNHPKAKLDDKRKKKIQAALKLGYSVAELEHAIEGYKFSPHHMGHNDSNTVYDDIELFLRDAKHIDKGIQLWTMRQQQDGKPVEDDPWQRGPSRGVHY